eukprot:TRINITY_DN2045_c0_g1_i4.p1 TRINITY_DN2045_c0_g1~~TRINITY_DN2045_c0_g1_i4.p1  ORF type:complete len:270 (+),score=65.77 TRINITY_DN2045_c0_g1_i4:81-812(+)
MAAEKRCSWLPLESNPEVLNPFCKRLGLEAGWGFADVFGLDEELLCMVPQPCVALCLLYPTAKISRPRREALRERKASMTKSPESLYFLQQHDDIGNACGTIAAVHALAHGVATKAFNVTDGSPLANFLAKTKPLGISERGRELESAKELQEMSDATAAAGETQGAGTDDANDSHFICFVHAGTLFELDGRTIDESGVAFPVSHGSTTAETFVSDAAKVIREDFMKRDPENVNFNVTALCKLD